MLLFSTGLKGTAKLSSLSDSTLQQIYHGGTLTRPKHYRNFVVFVQLYNYGLCFAQSKCSESHIINSMDIQNGFRLIMQ